MTSIAITPKATGASSAPKRLPEGFDVLLKDLTREILRESPEDIAAFAAGWCATKSGEKSMNDNILGRRSSAFLAGRPGSGISMGAYLISKMGISEAAKTGNLERLTHLVDAEGVDVNSRDESGWTPLHNAAREGFHECAQYLLNKGAKPYTTSYIDEQTPLHLAADCGSEEVLIAILKTDKSGIDMLNEDGWSAIHFAARSGEVAAVSALIDAGADVGLESVTGVTPLGIAKAEGFTAIVDALAAAGADVSGKGHAGQRPAGTMVVDTPASQFFKSLKVDDVCFNKGRLVSVSRDYNVKQALQELARVHILSAPVLDVEENKWLGLVDMADFVTFAVAVFSRRKKEDPITLNKHFFTHPIQQVRGNVAFSVVDYSKRNPYSPVTPDADLWECIKMLGKGLHRVPVVDENGVCVDVISQSAVCRWLADKIDKLGPKMEKTVGELGMGMHEVVTLPFRERAYRAFELMVERKISAVALVNDQGKVVGSLSVSDIKMVMSDSDLMVLLLPAHQYMNKIRAGATDIKLPNIFCKPETTFANVVGKLAATKVHRLFTVDDDGKPIGVVSLSDVFRQLIAP